MILCTPSCSSSYWQALCSKNLNTSPWPWSCWESDFQVSSGPHGCPQLHHEQSLCQFFWPLCFDFNKIIVWRIWLLLLWCFVSFFITAPKLGDFQIISQSSPPNSIQNKGCLQSGWSSGCHHHWGQNWLENRIADISRISVMYLVFQSIKVLGWSTGNVLCSLGKILI